MRLSPLLLAAMLIGGCVLTSPSVAVTKRDSAFELTRLAGERVALWPVASAKVDAAAASGVTEQYGSEDGFLDSLGKTISDRFVRPGRPPSLRSDQIVAALGGAEATRTLLDSRRLLGEGAESRFSGPRPALATLRSLPALDGIRYAVLFPTVSVDLQERVTSVGRSVGTVRWARARLHLAVVDLQAAGVVWEGDLGAEGTLDGPGMKQIENGLATALVEKGMDRPPMRGGDPGLCQTTADCPRGVCISGYCR